MNSDPKWAQCAPTVLMVRPARFGFNVQTSGTNPFQVRASRVDGRVARRALAEFDAVVEALRNSGVEVIVADDAVPSSGCDAVFPNNWFSTHHDGTVVLYPMMALNRRPERRIDIIDDLRSRYGFDVRRVVDLGPNERRNCFLEGTGSLVFDHANRIMYASLSPRTHRGMVFELEALLGYRSVVFQATDSSGAALYHTNVVMSVGEHYAVICAEAITDDREAHTLLEELSATGRKIFRIDRTQMAAFCANVLELRSAGGDPVLVVSERAWGSFTIEQRREFQDLMTVVSVPVPTIETVGGGGVRCMLAEIFLECRGP